MPAVRNLNNPGVLTEVVRLRLLQLLSLLSAKQFHIRSLGLTNSNTEWVTIDFRQFTTPTHTAVNNLCTVQPTMLDTESKYHHTHFLQIAIFKLSTPAITSFSHSNAPKVLNQTRRAATLPILSRGSYFLETHARIAFLLLHFTTHKHRSVS